MTRAPGELMWAAMLAHPLMLPDRTPARAGALLGRSGEYVRSVARGRLRISVALADRVEEVFGISAAGLLEAQAAWQLAAYRAGRAEPGGEVETASGKGEGDGENRGE